MNTKQMLDEIEKLKRERAVAMRCVAAVLSKGNENVRRDDLVACINDLAQAKVTSMENYEELKKQLKVLHDRLHD